jgi:hypothetical protein
MRITMIHVFCMGVLLQGCQSTKEGRPTVTVSATDFCSATAEVACYNLFKCCTGAKIEEVLGIVQTTNRSRCERDVKLICENNMAEVIWSVGQGRVAIDLPAAQRCLEALLAPEAGCFTVQTTAPWAEVCSQQRFFGTVSSGATCYNEYECAMNNYCGPDQKCHPKSGLGEDCSSGMCASGLYCNWDDQTCQTLVSQGQACDYSYQCAENLYCDFPAAGNPSCQPLKVSGAGCTDDLQCTSQYCIPGICNDGSACFALEDCSGTCADGGGYCSDDTDCSTYCNLSGAYCYDSADCPQTGDFCPLPTCNRACMGQPVCGDDLGVIDYCEDALTSLL